MKNKIMNNKKAQFFVAAGIIVIFVISFVTYQTLRTRGDETNPPQLLQTGYFFENAEREYNKIVEIVLANATNDDLPNYQVREVLGSLMNDYTAFLQDQAKDSGMSLVVTPPDFSVPGIGYIDIKNPYNKIIDVPLTMTLITPAGEFEQDISAIAQVTLEITNIEENLSYCQFTLSATGYNGEILTGLGTNLTMIAYMNDSEMLGCEYTYSTSEELYRINCTNGCANSSISVRVRDYRNIVATVYAGIGTVPQSYCDTFNNTCFACTMRGCGWVVDAPIDEGAGSCNSTGGGIACDETWYNYCDTCVDDGGLTWDSISEMCNVVGYDAYCEGTCNNLKVCSDTCWGGPPLAAYSDDGGETCYSVIEECQTGDPVQACPKNYALYEYCDECIDEGGKWADPYGPCDAVVGVSDCSLVSADTFMSKSCLSSCNALYGVDVFEKKTGFCNPSFSCYYDLSCTNQCQADPPPEQRN